MAVGKPIIGAINGSCNNFIKNNKVGYACASGDYEGLAKLISNLDIKELKEIGKASKETYFRKYSKDKYINKLVDTLKVFSK